MRQLLSIVIVEYNSEEEAFHCVDALSDKISMPYEVIISSNSCYDDAKRKSLSIKREKVSWVFNERNGGFAYAMNQGLKVAHGDYLVIMNSDCIVNSDLSDMAAFMRQHPEIGAMGPQIKDASGNIQDTARPYVSVQRYVLRQVRRMVKHQISVLETRMNYNRIQTVDWVIGAFIMVSRKAYEQTGGLDERFFMYAEDLDWCTRIRLNGFEVVYFPKARIEYKGTRRARSSKKYAKIFIRSHFLYWRKYGFFWGYPKRKAKDFN